MLVESRIHLSTICPIIAAIKQFCKRLSVIGLFCFSQRVKCVDFFFHLFMKSMLGIGIFFSIIRIYLSLFIRMYFFLRYPDYEFISDNSISWSAGLHNRYTENSLRGVILDIHFLSQTDFLVCTFSSQVGLQHIEMA